MGFFTALEQSGISRWMRESVLGYPIILALHTLGLAVLVGVSSAIDLRILGVAPRLPLAPMKTFFSVIWIGFAVNAVSGIALLIAYPTKEFTNPVLYVKLAIILLGVITIRLLSRRVFENPDSETTAVSMQAKILASVSLLLWA